MKRLSYIASILIAAASCSCVHPHTSPLSGVEERDGYCIKELSIDGITSFLLVPDGATDVHPAPAVLMLHDHGARFDIGKEKLACPLASSPEYIRRSARQWVDKNFEGVFLADSLCRMGYVVLVPDALYWGGRSSEDAQRWSRLSFSDETAPSDTLKMLKDRVYEGQMDVYEQCVSEMGKEWAEVILQDDLKALEWLSGQSFVNADRIASFGFSMGAHRSWFLAANTDLLHCAVAQNWMTMLSAADTTSASSYSMSVSELRHRMDIPEIASMASPTPMLMIAGERDHLFPREAVEEAFGIMQSKYTPGALRTVFFDGEHECPKRVQSIVVSYLDEQLKN